MKMILPGLTILSAIMAVGAIDGPSGYENDNWGLCFGMMGAMLVFAYLSFRTGAFDE
jgi:hypothetical protein|tara:strand:+ start:220 stop:390 length:171 start_codon:yes stop_codon:yes gene_type:complete